MRRESGFTLIEIVAVVAVMGILAATSVLTLSHVAGQERLRNVSQELEQADALVRSAARQSGKVQHLVFDLNRNQVQWQGDSKDQPTELVQLRQDWQVSVQMVQGTVSSGQAEVEYSPAGDTPSYAVDLGFASEAAGQPRWMIVAGLSGSIYWTNDEKHVRAIFKTLSGQPAVPSAEPATRTNAD